MNLKENQIQTVLYNGKTHKLAYDIYSSFIHVKYIQETAMFTTQNDSKI